MIEPYSWFMELTVTPFDWGTHGSEWQAGLERCLSGSGVLQYTGMRYDDTTRPFIRHSASRSGGKPCDVDLLVRPLPEGGAVVIVAGLGDPDETAADAWAQAAQCATERLGSPGDEFAWTAVVGHPPSRIGGTEVVLADSCIVGGMTLTGSDQALTEAGPELQPSLGAWSTAISWPVLVEGSHVGYNWNAASQAVALDLHRLCGLISVALGAAFVVREAPAPVERGRRTVPARLPWQSSALPPSQPTPARPAGVSMPRWVDEAWSVLVSRPWLGHAVSSFHEGVRAQVLHPSLALVAFIASVEAVANRLFEEVQCSECDGHRYVAARFRATLGVVMEEGEAERLGNVYSRRSKTVHQGVLHGSERQRGAFPMPGVFQLDPVIDFEW